MFRLERLIPSISYLTPLDQPFSDRRLVRWLLDALNSGDFTAFKAIVAFSKEAGLARLEAGLNSFRQRGGLAQIVLGVDLLGTSKQAIEFALGNFDSAHVWHHPSLFTTFHPKLYLFEGPRKATATSAPTT